MRYRYPGTGNSMEQYETKGDLYHTLSPIYAVAADRELAQLYILSTHTFPRLQWAGPYNYSSSRQHCRWTLAGEAFHYRSHQKPAANVSHVRQIAALLAVVPPPHSSAKREGRHRQLGVCRQ